MRYAKGLMRLTATGRRYAVEVRPHFAGEAVELRLHRDDAKGGPCVELRLDEAQALLRSLQSACDRARQHARDAHRAARADAELELVVDRLARRLR